MGSEMVYECVGCPQGCIHCGRENPYRVWFCDECFDKADGDRDYLYIGKHGEELCKSCYLKQFDSDCPEEIEECEECGCIDDLYFCDGRWLCADCIMDDADRIRVDD